MVNKKRFITVKDITENKTYCIDCQNPVNCFKVAQHFHKIGEYKYRQIRFRSTIPPNKLNYILLKFEDIINGA